MATVGAEVPLLVAAALVATAGPSFARRARATPSRAGDRAGGLGPIRVPGVQTLVLVTALADAALGVVDVAVIAEAVERGQPAVAGVLLALFTTGAVVGGIASGARSWHQPPARRLVVILGAFAVALAVLALTLPLVVVFAGLLLLAGAPSAAQSTTTSIALDDVAPDGQGAEAYTWLSSANAVGVGLGGVVGGTVVEARGPATAFLIAAALATAAAAALLARPGTLRPAAVGPSHR